MTVATAVEIDVDAPLSAQEQADLKEHEETLRTGFAKMEEMAVALRQIQKRKLYRGKFRTFEAYIRTEWKMAVSRAYQLCTFGEVSENLRLHNCGEIPINEAQARELAKVPAEVQPEVLKAAAAEGKPTAKAIANKVREVAPHSKPKNTTAEAIKLASKATGMSESVIKSAQSLRLPRELIEKVKTGELTLVEAARKIGADKLPGWSLVFEFELSSAPGRVLFMKWISANAKSFPEIAPLVK